VKRWSWVLMVAVLLGALVAGSTATGAPRSNAARARAVADSIKCPVCRSQSVADSDAPASRAIRLEVARQVDAGRTDDQIRSSLAAKYGEDILLNPSRSGLAGLVWSIPVAALVLAIAGLAAAFRRWRSWPTS
jgi:cytochrome c-type biogenesis protein CcmH